MQETTRERKERREGEGEREREREEGEKGSGQQQPGACRLAAATIGASSPGPAARG